MLHNFDRKVAVTIFYPSFHVTAPLLPHLLFDLFVNVSLLASSTQHQTSTHPPIHPPNYLNILNMSTPIDYANIPTPPAAVADFCLIPVSSDPISWSSILLHYLVRDLATSRQMLTATQRSVHLQLRFQMKLPPSKDSWKPVVWVTLCTALVQQSVCPFCNIGSASPRCTILFFPSTQSWSDTMTEGSWDEVMRLIGQAHTLVHQNGVLRVQTDIRAGTRYIFPPPHHISFPLMIWVEGWGLRIHKLTSRRTDKKQHFAEKVSKVESILAGDKKEWCRSRTGSKDENQMYEIANRGLQAWIVFWARGVLQHTHSRSKRRRIGTS